MSGLNYGNSSRRREWTLAAVFVCWLSGAGSVLAAGHPTPMALPTDRQPWQAVTAPDLHRQLEAETKTRVLFASKRLRASGVEKATANMDLYDVHFYDLDLDIDPTTRVLTGEAVIAAAVVGDSMTTIDLHLGPSMNVSAVQAGGVPTTFARTPTVLSVTLDRTYVQGELLQVVVNYAGNPTGGGLTSEYFGWSSYGGQPLLWTLSEPYGAREWWPCKDLNTDKADSVALHVTVPDNLIVASNGTLDQVTVPAPGRMTYHWTERYPIVTYLVSVTAHSYAVFTDEYVSAQGDTMPLEYYVVQDRLASAMAGYAVVPDMISAFAGLFGEYPFIEEKYGHAHFLWGGGMEHQTCTSLTYASNSEGLIAHELAHQWFGDLITCSDFAHIWVNEGFATWSEAYWREQNEGVAAYHDEMNDARYLGPGTIIVETPEDFSTIFNFFTTYQKASWVPHMLRRMVGEGTFAAALTRFRTDRAYGDANTADVQAAFEAESGLDLTAFFQQWIYGEYYPAYGLSWTTASEGAQSRVQVRIAQTQTNTGLFAMPLDLRVRTDQGDTTFVVQNSSAEQWYDFVVDGVVSDVQLDPDDWVLCTVSDEGVSAVEQNTPQRAVELLTNVPNPFNPTTAIRFHLAQPTAVQLAIHDLSGRLVKKLVAGTFAAGDHRVRWDGTDGAGRAVASGTYFARLRGGQRPQVRSLTLIR